MYQVFAVFAKPIALLLNLLYNLVDGLGIPGSYGIAIVLLTLIVRGVLFPLYSAQMKQSAKMQDLQPKMQQLQKQYGADKEKYNQKIMELYQVEGVNPAKGCLPLLIQMPILFGLFAALRNPLMYMNQDMILAVHESFLWIPDLSQPDKWILPILAGITTYFSYKITQSANPSSASSMKVLQYIFPLMIVWWGRSFPAGLTIYWFVGTLFMCIQQHFVLSRLKKQRLKKEEEERYRKEHPELFPEEPEEEKPVKPSEVKIIETEDEYVFDEETDLEELEDEYADFYTVEELQQMKKDKEANRKKNKNKKKK